ncbi:MAG TPA: tripartite tricarboxylate transporter substrate binding protein [Burkholderiales bacterium]|nr:tripartite tricarboxylate transporter substrate binding protein [Burkholderiales bacterium]
MIAKALLAALLTAAPFLIQAQDAYPSKPVTIVVPYPPAGQADLAARPLANALQGILKQPFVVMNRPGAAGAVGNRAVAAATPDGYTILVTLVSITTIPEVERMFGRTQSYSMDQFAPLALLVADPPVLAVAADQPWKSVKELVDDAKRRPDDIVYSHSGLYGPSHLPMEMFLHAAGLKMRGLPAVGGGPTMALVLGGSAAMWASPPAMAVPQVAGGKMRTLASFGAKRHPAFPDAPTLKELGYDVEFYVWSGAFAPAGTPPAVLATLRDAIRKAVASAEFTGAMEKMKTPITFLDGKEFQDFLARDAAAGRKAVQAIGKVE